ncbi:hypothetical protein N0V94_003595 [Neodidymelliopsis sp. IMI 364377]|nr:hypothetical protein N0V94_003595 [Neodidymelliopsis sp. IMI 364377]
MQLFDNGDTDGSMALAKYNLTDPALPPHYFIKNAILVACVLDDWTDADCYRLAVKQAHIMSVEKAKMSRDEKSLKALEKLRLELDELEEFRAQDGAEYMAGVQVPDSDDEVGDDEVRDDAVTSNTLNIPIRPVGQYASRSAPSLNVVTPTDDSYESSTASPVPPVTKKFRHQKSAKLSKGGPYHMHAFTKSLGKGLGFARECLGYGLEGG